MKRAAVSTIGAITVAVALSTSRPHVATASQTDGAPDVIDAPVGRLILRAHIWRPSGSGPFPAVLFNHGSYTADDPLPPSDPQTIGSVFARHGYVFLWLYRQGTGLSTGQGAQDGEQMARA